MHSWRFTLARIRDEAEHRPRTEQQCKEETKEKTWQGKDEEVDLEFYIQCKLDTLDSINGNIMIFFVRGLINRRRAINIV